MTSAIFPLYEKEKAQPYPSDVSPRLYGNQNHQAIFSWYTEDIISLATEGGSPLLQWLPSRGVNTWNAPIGHLSWIAPEGMDGSQTYADYLADQVEVGECEYGDGTVYQTCEYNHQMDRITWSTKNEPIKRIDRGMKLWERMPQHVLRGDSQGITIDNDLDWSLFRLASVAEEHLNWNELYGDEDVYPNTYLGYSNIINQGWVRQRMTGRGSCDFTDPIVINGVDLTDNTAILKKLVRLVKRLMRRMAQRNYTPRGDDMVIVMSDVMWDYLSETLAWGVNAVFNPPAGIDVTVTTDAILREQQRIRTGGVGFGSIRINGLEIPVIPEPRMGVETQTDDGDPAITGDILVMTKRYKGITILEHQYLDWSKIPGGPMPELSGFHNGEYSPQFFNNNMFNVSVLTLEGTNDCWYYGMEMYGRNVSYMNMMQGRINDVTVLTEMTDENENISFTNQDYYAYNGEKGGQGNVLLHPLT